MMDLNLSLLMLGLMAAAAVAYGVRYIHMGAAHHARIEEAGSSVLLGKGAMEAAYWSLGPVARAAVFFGLTANGITLLSLVLSVAGAVALGLGHFGLGGALTVIAALGDALDGLVARQTGTASDAGEVFDAAVDRYAEFFFLMGLAYYFRAQPAAMVLPLLAVLGSFMVSYGTAKAEALQVEAPRGAMRRAERAVYLISGVIFAPVFGAAAARFGLPAWLEVAPVLFTVGLVAVVSNVSAVRRFVAITRAVAARAGQQPAAAAAAVVPDNAVESGAR